MVYCIPPRVLHVFLILSLVLHAPTTAKNSNPSFHNRIGFPEHVLWNGNLVSTIHGNHGNMVDYDVTGNSGQEWPKGSGNHMIFQSGFWLIAGKVNGQEEIRSASAEYVSEYTPGLMGGPDSSGHIYQVCRNEIDAFLNNDWATFSTMTLPLPHTVIDGANIYTETVDTPLPTSDFMNWPVADGAPWFDADSDGVYTPSNGDYPTIKGDLFHWYVMNDHDPENQTYLWETEPLGVNVRVSTYGFGVPGPIGDAVFIEWEIENAGEDILDSLFIGWWADMDIMRFHNDLSGCDTLLNLAYSYNGSELASEDNVSGGLVLLETPVVPSPGDTAWVDHDILPDYMNLPPAGHSIFIGGSPAYSDPGTAEEAYRALNGLDVEGNPYYDPVNNAYTHFAFSGNPVTGEGWADDMPQGDRRQMISAGPFRMEPGDTQRIVGAMLFADGIDNIAAVAGLYEKAEIIHEVWDNDFAQLGPLAFVEDLSAMDNTESIGPLYMQFRITSLSNVDIVSPTHFLHYGLENLGSTINLIMNPIPGDTTYAIWLPPFEEVTGTETLFYSVTVNAANGQSVDYPLGVPYNYYSLIFGPDTVPPMISTVSWADTLHHLLPVQQLVFLEQFYDDRFGHSTPLLNWQINAEPFQSTEMVYDATLPDLPGYPPRYWFGWITAPAVALGDSLSYWVTAVDGSQNQNLASTDTITLYSGKKQTLGKWEYYYDAWQYNYFDIYDWDFFRQFSFSYDGAAVPGLEWGLWAVLRSSPPESDTLTYTLPLDLSDFDNAWLDFKYLRSGTTDCCREWLEGSFDGSTWFLIDSMNITAPIGINHMQQSLQDYIGENTFYFRMIIRKDSSEDIAYRIGNILFHTDSTLVGVDNDTPALPDHYALYQNYPNPFNPVTTIRYELPEQTAVKLVVYDVLGQEVAVLINEQQASGIREVKFDARELASGIYFYRLSTPTFTKTRKLVVLK
ncbi:MAG: T9SS type A sorting domain-containing protein [Fidelibacterota bacterium]